MSEQADHKKERMVGPELLRCVAMMMIVVLHYLGKGNLLPNSADPGSYDAQGLTALALECLAIVAVNVYMLISGYFLSVSQWKLSRLLSLYVQLWLYSVVVGLVSLAFGVVPDLPPGQEGMHMYLELFLPISMDHYWFLTAYVFFYLLLPFLGRAVRSMGKLQMQVSMIGLLFFHSLVKTVLPIRLETDTKGYSFLWYVCLFLVAAYLRKYPPKWFQRKGICCLLYFLGVMGIYSELLLFNGIYQRTGSLSWVLSVPMEYNHFFVLLASVGLFGWGLQWSPQSGAGKKLAGVMKWAAPYTLGVYLLHENLILRYAWQNWLGADRVNGVLSVLGHTALAVFLVFFLGVLLDFLREKLQKTTGVILRRIPLYSRAEDWVRALDESMRINEQ